MSCTYAARFPACRSRISGNGALNTQTFTARDDRFHFAEIGDAWWATETARFSFHDARRRLGRWLYTMVRPNIGTIAGGAWLWDDTAHLPWEALYSANYSALQLPRDQNLDDCRLPTGVSIRVIEPCMRYALGYDDADRLQARLQFDGVMPPEPLTAVGSTFGSAHHFDQFGRITGELVLYGEHMTIDCIGMRDGTWGLRPEHRPRQAAYVTAASTMGTGFLRCRTSDHRDAIAYGFIRRYGATLGLTAGERSVERDPSTWVTRIDLRHRLDGRELLAVGEAVSRMVMNRHSFIDINSLVRWGLDGADAWGEDQDMWPVHRWSQFRREATR